MRRQGPLASTMAAIVVGLLLALGASSPAVQAESLPAFPGAEGYGAFARGGRGGRVLFVTNLNDDGPGSLRRALEAKGPRMVLFRVGGVIRLQRTLVIDEPYLTIAGQTAPGDGITITGAGLQIRAGEVIVRNLRLRVGDAPGGEAPAARDGIVIAGRPGAPIRNVIIDRCSVSWAIDENASVYQAEQVTIQWSLLAEGLEESLHPNGRHSNGLLLAEGAREVSVHHNLLAHNGYRNPQIKGDTVVAFEANLVYNWGRGALIVEDSSGAGPSRVVVARNLFTPGPATSNERAVLVDQSTHADSELYLDTNSGLGRPTLDRPVTVDRSPLATADAPVSEMTPAQLRAALLDEVGATAPRRDPIDDRIVASVRSRGGQLINTVAEVGGWEILDRWRAGELPRDSDRDGIPDSWERARGLNPANSSDASRIAPSGYSWLEEYLNELLPARAG